MSNARLDLSISPEAAKAAKDRIKTAIEGAWPDMEVVSILTGDVGKQPFECDAISKESPTGRVLAWRIVAGDQNVEVLPWTVIEPMDVSPSCGGLKEILKKEASQ